MNFLIVDDSRAIRFKLQRMLEELGHTVIGEAQNGKEALEFLKKHKPDVVTLDVVMPEMTGMEVLEEIKKLAIPVKVVMVTSAASLSNMMSARGLGALNFLTKPFTKERVAEVVQSLENTRQVA